MDNQNNLQDKELKNVNAGMTDGMTVCRFCNGGMDPWKCEQRNVGSGCSKTKQFKCPQCGQWN